MTTATTTTGLNLRSGPGTQFSVIEVLLPQMFEAFTANENNQIVGLFNFIKGPGQAAQYGSLMHGLLDIFQRRRPAGA